MYLVREVAHAGGLMSYGPDYEDVFRRSAGFIDRILYQQQLYDMVLLGHWF